MNHPKESVLIVEDDAALREAEAIDPELEALDLWHAAGLRSLGPVWSRPNRFAEGVPFLFGTGPDTGPGLTPAGVGLARRCRELGILVDLAHLNEAGFWDVAALELGPLVVSHSAAHAVAPGQPLAAIRSSRASPTVAVSRGRGSGHDMRGGQHPAGPDQIT